MGRVNAQMLLQNQYLFDPTVQNPAIGAKFDYPSLKLNSSKKWFNLPNSPQVSYLSYNHTLIKQNMGFNVAISADQYGSITSNQGKISYFYFTKLNIKGDFISYGAYAAIARNIFNMPEQMTNDPALTYENNRISSFKPIFGAGIYYKTKDYAISFNIDNLIPIKNKAQNTSFEPNQKRSYSLLLETTFENEIQTFGVIPSIFVRVDEKLDRELHINCKFIVKRSIWFGFSYRDALDFQLLTMHNAGLLIGLKFFRRLNIMYMYEFNVTQTRSILGPNHYLTIGFDFFSSRKNVPLFF